MMAKKLKSGDEVRIIAPSGSLARLDDKNFAIAIERFRSMNLNVTISKNAYVVDEYSSSSIQQRVDDIHDAFIDENVKMIICAIGGHNVIQILDKIDYNLIKDNPKIIIGYSDNTALLNAIYTKTGLVTYIGPNFADFAVKLGFEYTFEYFKKIVIENSSFIVEDSNEYSDDQWYINQDSRIFLPNSGRKSINNYDTEGEIIGGNLCTLQLLQGTSYMPDLKDKILFLEDDDLVGDTFLFEFDRNLHSLMLQKNFKRIKGIIIGRMQIGSKVTIEDLEKLFKSKKVLKNIPIIVNVDFGHTRPLITFPIGGKCKITNGQIEII